MKRNLTILGLMVFLLTFTSVAEARILRVGQNQPYTKIQDAIDAAQSGDVVLIRAGTYSPSTNGEQFPIIILSKENVYILGEDANETIVDNDIPNINCMFLIQESNSITIDSIALERKIDYQGLDFGILVWLPSRDLTIKRCRFLVKNSIWFEEYGGGEVSVTIANNYFQPPFQEGSGAIRMGGTGNPGIFNGNFLIEKNTIIGAHFAIRTYYPYGDLVDYTIEIKNNLILDSISGIYHFAYSPPSNVQAIIENNTLSGGNTALHIDSGEANCIIKNNIIVNHNNFGIYNFNDPEHIDISYNDVWDSELGNYYGCAPGIGDISADPRFVDPANGDYHLSNLSGNYSPAIDAGDSASDFSREPEPNGDRINMGAYGNTPEAETTGRVTTPPRAVPYGGGTDNKNLR